jgi:hypothetical protein
MGPVYCGWCRQKNADFRRRLDLGLVRCRMGLASVFMHHVLRSVRRDAPVTSIAIIIRKSIVSVRFTNEYAIDY